MSRRLFLLFLLSTPALLRSQNIQLDIEPCQAGIIQAEWDAKEGIYKVISFGYPIYTDWEFEKFYVKFLEERYGIILSDGGCVITEEAECYSNRMSELIYTLFGDTIFEYARNTAKFNYHQLVRARIDSGFVFSRVEDMPKISVDGLEDRLASEIGKVKGAEGKITCSMVIEKDGRIGEIKIKESLNRKADKRVLNAISALPEFIAGSYFGQAARVRMYVSVIFTNGKVDPFNIKVFSIGN